MGNKDKTKDGDATTPSKTNRDHSHDQEARDTVLVKTIAKAVARETQSITEVFPIEMAKAYAQYQDIIKELHNNPTINPLSYFRIKWF